MGLDPETDPPSSRLTVFMFTDVADSTALKQPGALGAPRYAALAQRHDTIFRGIVESISGGDILKDVGDGFMATFPTASDAVRAALRFQFVLHRDPDFSPLGRPFRVRIGIHQGEVSVLDLDINGRPKLIGPAADMTARLQSLALPGQILVSRTAFNDARQYVREHPVCGDASADGACPLLRWVAHGHYRFKGIEDPHEVFGVGAESDAPSTPPPDTEKAKYVGSPDDEAVRGWRPATGQTIPGRSGWILDRQLGLGGFGEVWLGQHHKTRERRVFKFCFDVERLRSFRREITLFRLLREALGDRPDIAKLHEYQLDKPPFHLESEYSELGDLRTWSEAQGGITAISLDNRLELVARVCDAVSAAHSVGVLHKDLKPSNILMYRDANGVGLPRLADFGIGILTDRSQLEGRSITVAGFTGSNLSENSSSRTGTRMYAPPELDVGKPFTMQGDVFALGVILYQMVIGDLDRPLGLGWERDVADELLREEIGFWADLDPARRPSGTGKLASRLRTLDERRAARALEAKQRDAQRLAEQHAAEAGVRRRRARLVVSALASVAVALALGLAGTLWMARVAAREAAAAHAAESEQRRLATSESQARAEAQAQRTAAIETSIALRTRAEELRQVADFQSQILDQIDARVTGAEHVRTIREQFSDALRRAGVPDDEVRVRADNLDEELLRISPTDLAGDMINRIILAPSIRALKDGIHDPLIVAALRHTLAKLAARTSRFEDAIPLEHDALAVRRHLLGTDHPDTLTSINAMGELLLTLGRLDEAEPHVRTALERRRAVLGEDHPDALRSAQNWGVLLRDTSRFEEAETVLRDAHRRFVRVRGDDHPESFRVINDLGMLLRRTKRFDEAETLFRETLAKEREALGNEAGETLATLNNLGAVLHNLKRYDEAEACYREALARSQSTLGEKHPDTLNLVNNLCAVYRDAGKFAQAESLYRRSIPAFTAMYGGRDWRVGAGHLGLGRVLMGLKRWGDANAELQSAEAVLAAGEGQSPGLHRSCLEYLVLLHETWDREDPGRGHDAAAREWRAKADQAAQNAVTTPTRK